MGALDALESSVRVRAAIGVLDQLTKLRDQNELERRISELEATIEQQQS